MLNKEGQPKSSRKGFSNERFCSRERTITEKVLRQVLRKEEMNLKQNSLDTRKKSGFKSSTAGKRMPNQKSLEIRAANQNQNVLGKQKEC